MKVQLDTINEAFANYAALYSKRWDIPHQLRLYSYAEEAFEGKGDAAAFSKVYDHLRAHWQVFRRGSAKWGPDRAFQELVALPREVRSLRLSKMKEHEWGRVWECINRVKDVKRNKEGPSLVAVSKFLHFWNPGLFIIYDHQQVETFVFGHHWLGAEVMKSGTPPVADLPDPDKSRLAWYLYVLHWASRFLTTNTQVAQTFLATVRIKAANAEAPRNIERYEATAIEWFLLGLVQVPPRGVALD